MRRENDVWTDLALGVAAGVTATWAMHQTTSYLYEHEDPEARAREDSARGDRTSYEVAAEKAANRLGASLTPSQRSTLGSGLHWALGGAAGAAYALLRRYVPAAGKGQGLMFGTAFFGLVDEGATTALGLTPGPTAFPWQAHARGFAGHLVFGLVADSFLDVADATRRVVRTVRPSTAREDGSGRAPRRGSQKRRAPVRRALSLLRNGR